MQRTLKVRFHLIVYPTSCIFNQLNNPMRESAKWQLLVADWLDGPCQPYTFSASLYNDLEQDKTTVNRDTTA